MKSFIYLLRFFTVVCFVMMIVNFAVAQNESTDIQYKPEVGQEGKDVVWVPTTTGTCRENARFGEGYTR